ncbi:MAG: GGDEF domain-containing protein [Deltaproteobacteria bacterium]|nr:GGDEF domain-containing protein [Deltaproteobacteria bacterium]
MIKRKRPLIAAIFPAVHDDCQSIVWPGVADFATEHNIDLLTFIATSQNKVATFDPHYDIVKALTQHLELDGLIIYTGAFSDHFDVEELSAFCRSLNTCPMVCISQKVADIPSILIDNELGIRKTIQHLIREHNCKTFAFVKGHENHTESEARFHAFTSELAANRLSVDESLIFSGHFIKDSGIEAARKMLAMDKLPDAVLCVNDGTALGVISEFAAHRVQVPGDICVAGFDDVPEALNHVPSLTTIRQPLYAIGQIAAESLLKLVNGNEMRGDVFVSTKFIPRQSCGCIHSHVLDARLMSEITASIKTNPDSSKKEFIDHCNRLIIGDNREIGDETANKWAESLIQTLTADVKAAENDETPNRFLERLTFIMVQHISSGGGAEVWQDVITSFAARWRSFMGNQDNAPVVEGILTQARMVISDFVLRMNLSEELAKDDNRALIRNIMLSLITAFDINRVKNVLKENLPTLGIKACHLVLYGTDREGVSIDMLNIPQTSSLVLSFNENGMIVDAGESIQFPTREILPESVWKTDTKKNHLLFPIVFERRTYGYAIFQRAADLPHYVYEELRIHIGNALRGHNLVHELREMSLRDELTGLYNRRGFTYLGNHLISQAKRTGASVTMMYGDMNRLKMINDTYGHAEGDFAISKTAELLKSSIRDQDIIARIGGDEFTIIAVDMNERDCRGIVDRIDLTFREFNDKQLRPYELSISVGYTHEADPTALSIGQLLENADQMLGKIKRQRGK